MTDASYLQSEPRSDVEIFDVPAVSTVVQKVTDQPLSVMAEVFDSTFTALFPLLESRGITPTGPGFSLHHRMPDETATFEVGIPVDRPLDGEVTADNGVVFSPSTLPAGHIATVSHLGPYDGLSDAWGAFLQRVSDGGSRPQLPFWEVYVSEPGPEADPATLRTDLYTVIAETGEV